MAADQAPCPWDSPGKNTGVGCHFLLQCMKVKSESEVTQSCQTLCDPMDCRIPGSSVHGIFQARVLEWGTIAFSWCVRWVQLSGSLSILWHCLSLELEWKHVFQSCGHCCIFQICWHIECNSFTASSFRIWNSSTGIPSLPLPLFVVMLPKAHLTSCSRMSGSRWVITPSWLSGSWRSFLYSSSVYSSLVAHRLKRLPPMQETWFQSLGWEDSLEKDIITHSSILAWRIPRMEESGRL